MDEVYNNKISKNLLTSRLFYAKIKNPTPKRWDLEFFELVNIDCDILTNISKYVILKMPNKNE